VREIISSNDREALSKRLHEARQARANLPARVVHPEELAEFRIPIPDRAGAAAEVFTLAAELSVNIASFEVVHVAESNRGVAVVIVDRALVELFRGGLIARGFRPAVEALS
jgi:prephenate dehydrogenase